MDFWEKQSTILTHLKLYSLFKQVSLVDIQNNIHILKMSVCLITNGERLLCNLSILLSDDMTSHIINGNEI